MDHRSKHQEQWRQHRLNAGIRNGSGDSSNTDSQADCDKGSSNYDNSGGSAPATQEKTEPSLMVSVAHILELLVPRFANVSDIPGSFPVSLDLSASMDVQLVFWERGVTKELECINVDDGCPRCKFDSFLRGLVILKRRGVLHLNGAYVVEPTKRNFARLRLHIESINEMAAASKLEEFDFVLCHLQSSDREEEEMEEQKIAAAKRSK
ncbi:F-box protein, partial [Phytophthora palmivora]